MKEEDRKIEEKTLAALRVTLDMYTHQTSFYEGVELSPIFILHGIINCQRLIMDTCHRLNLPSGIDTPEEEKLEPFFTSPPLDHGVLCPEGKEHLYRIAAFHRINIAHLRRYKQTLEKQQKPLIGDPDVQIESETEKLEAIQKLLSA